MQHLERLAFIAAASWFFQTTSSNHLAVVLALAQQNEEDEGPKSAWRSSKQFTIKKLVDVWDDDEERGGFSENLFEFFSRFKREEVKKLAFELEIPTEFDIDPRTGYPNAKCASPEEALLVFLWRSAHLVALAHLISFFGKSRAWLSRVWNGVLNYLWEEWGNRIRIDQRLLSPRRID